MSKRVQIWVMTVSLALSLVAIRPAPAAAQSFPDGTFPEGLGIDDLLDTLSPDSLLDPPDFSSLVEEMAKLPGNTAIWLAEHLPATMTLAGMGSGLSLSEDFSFALGVTPIRLGFFNKFNKVFEPLGDDDPNNDKPLEFIAEMAPPLMVWPQFGATVGFGFWLFEASAEVQFLPQMDLTLVEGVDVAVETFSAGAALRFRFNDPMGLFPAFIVGCSGNYYRGNMMFAARMASQLPLSSGLGPVSALGQEFEIEGTYSFESVTHLEWELYMLTPEFRMAWKAGPFQPYVGVGLGFAHGQIHGEADVSVQVELTTINGFTGKESAPSKSSKHEASQYDPAPYLLQPHVGFDIDLGMFAMTAQLDFAVAFNSKDAILSANVDDVLDDATSETADYPVSMVATVGARFQF